MTDYVVEGRHFGEHLEQAEAFAKCLAEDQNREVEIREVKVNVTHAFVSRVYPPAEDRDDG